MSILLNLNIDNPRSPKIDLVGDDDLKDELILFLDLGMQSLNGFNSHFLSEFVFNSENGHPRWDFFYKDEDVEHRPDELASLVSLNLAWDCWLIAKGLRER